MAPVRFANACAACHLLTFDKRFEEGVPHDRLDIVHAFVVKKFSDYIAAHPNELREMQDPARDLTGKPLTPGTRTVTSSEWVREQVIVAEELLWHKTCAQCHAHCARTFGIHGHRTLVCRHRGLGSSNAACCDHSRGAWRGAAANRACADYIALDAACEIRSLCAHWFHLRELPREGADEHGIERRVDPGDCDLPKVPCAGTGACGIEVLRVPHLSRLVEAEGSHAEIYVAGAAHWRTLTTCGTGFSLCAQAERDIADRTSNN